MLTLTENAANEIGRQLVEAGDDSSRVRISVEAGGCAGTKYIISPGSERQSGDREVDQFGLTVLVDPISLTAIEGLQVDFVDALMGGGFRFDNPGATSSCGCGLSFKGPKAESLNIA
jgi:iron-sulfur cluster assembly accessory protein